MKEKSKSFFAEFREFAMRGNMLDLAIGVVIGTAFNKIVSSLVTDIISPPLGILLGGVNFDQLKVTLPTLPGVDKVTINYGVFIQSVMDFVIIAFALFLLIKALNSLKRRFEKEQEKGVAPRPADVVLLEEIRDILRAK